MTVETRHRELLLDVARASILERLEGADGGLPGAGAWPAAMAQPGASFVTLTVDDALRGCIGSLEASRALAEDVWSNARRTAFEDPRFTPLARAEVSRAALEIAVLGPLQVMVVASEEELLAAIRPGVDGLLISLGQQRATFLPKVWRTLPEAPLFLRQLKRKMGVADHFWDPAMEVRRYRTQEFGGPLAC